MSETNSRGDSLTIQYCLPLGIPKDRRYSDIANQVVNWIQYDTDARRRFEDLCADHMNSRKTGSRLYYSAADFVAKTSAKYGISMATVMHCALEIAKNAGWFDSEEES